MSLASETERWGDAISCLATCYCQVSRSHLMPLASRLGTLIALDPAVDAELIEKETVRLMEDAAKAEECIRQLMIRRRSDHGDAGVEIGCVTTFFQT